MVASPGHGANNRACEVLENPTNAGNRTGARLQPIHGGQSHTPTPPRSRNGGDIIPRRPATQPPAMLAAPRRPLHTTTDQPRRWKPHPDTEQITGRVKCEKKYQVQKSGRNRQKSGRKVHIFRAGTATNPTHRPPTHTEQERRPLHTDTTNRAAANGAAPRRRHHTDTDQPTSRADGGSTRTRSSTTNRATANGAGTAATSYRHEPATQPPAMLAAHRHQPTTEQHHEPADQPPHPDTSGHRAAPRRPLHTDTDQPTSRADGGSTRTRRK